MFIDVDEIICDLCVNYQPSLSGTDVGHYQTCKCSHLLTKEYIEERMNGNELHCMKYKKI